MATTTATANPAKPVAQGRMAAWRALWADQGKRRTVQALSLIVVWGLAWFLWGTIGAWDRFQAKQALQNALVAAQPEVEEWLDAPFNGLRLTGLDPLLLEALQTPLGLASPAAERSLAAIGERLADPDVMLFDAGTGRTLTQPGSTAPQAEVLTRLTALPATAEKLVASGTRTGVLYFAWRLPLPEKVQVYVVRPLSIRQLASQWRQAFIPEKMTLVMMVPHPEGMALWDQQAPLRLSLKQELPALQKAVPSTKFPEISLVAHYVKPVPGTGWLVKTMVVIWALVSTLLILWTDTAPVRQAIGRVVGPVVQPIRQALRTLMGLIEAFFQQFSLSLPFAGLLGWCFGTKTTGVEGGWEGSATVQSAAEADLAAPGQYSAADFGSTKPVNKPQLKPRLKPLAPKTPSNQDQMAKQEDIDKDLMKDRVQRCIRQGLVELLYQPMYRSRDNAVEGNEVFARLADAGGVISPGQFLPILGAMGQIAMLDALVFEKVIEQHFSVGKSPPVVLSLNISGTSLEDLGYLRDVAKRGPSVLKHLMFEVRSNEVVRDPNALQLLKALQRQGARVAVDYFGGGSAMVEASKALGIDFIKMDMMRFSSTSTLKKEFHQVCGLAETLKLAVVVERIEGKDEEVMARQAGATLLQGYSIGKPTSNLVTLPLPAKM